MVRGRNAYVRAVYRLVLYVLDQWNSLATKKESPRKDPKASNYNGFWLGGAKSVGFCD